MVLGRDTFAGDLLARLGVATLRGARRALPRGSAIAIRRRRGAAWSCCRTSRTGSAPRRPEAFPGLRRARQRPPPDLVRAVADRGARPYWPASWGRPGCAALAYPAAPTTRTCGRRGRAADPPAQIQTRLEPDRPRAGTRANQRRLKPTPLKPRPRPNRPISSPGAAPENDSAPGSILLTRACRLGRCAVASRRAAQRGSSRTVFREGNSYGPGDPNAPAKAHNAPPPPAIPARPGSL